MRKNISFLLLLVLFMFVLCGTGCAESTQKDEDNVPYKDFLIREAELPSIPICPDMNNSTSLNDEKLAQYKAWWEAKEEHQRIEVPGIEQLQDFTCVSTRKLIEERKDSNFLYSPISLWFCLHTLADLTDGDSQSQILQVIGQQTDEARDEQVDAVFRSLYWEDDTSVCIPAMSVWQNKSTGISKSLIDRLAAVHNAVFQGNMGESSYDAALQAWLNEKTRDLLKDSATDLNLSPNDGLAVCSTLYLKDGWLFRFSESRTSPDVFCSEDGEVTTDFMHGSNMGAVYMGNGFTATILDFEDGGGVAFILPDESISPEGLLRDDEAFRFLFSGRDWCKAQVGKINLSIPKIDCLTDFSIQIALEKMGITNIFNPQITQFSPELSSDSAISLSVLKQYAHLILNEEGVEAAAITISADGTMLRPPEEEIDFTLNRPFVYAVMSERGIPLFIGTYHTPG